MMKIVLEERGSAPKNSSFKKKGHSMKRMLKHWLLSALIIVMLLSVITGCHNDKQAETNGTSSTSIHFAVVYGFGGLGDNGYNDEVHEGAKMAAKQFNATFDNIEPKDLAEFESQLQLLASTGEYDVLIVISTEHLDAMRSVAVEFPEQKFCMLDSAINDLPNVSSITASHPEQHFLSGMLAGIATLDDRFPKSNSENILGFTIAMDNPVSRAQASGFFAGAKYVNPNVEILYSFIGSYADPGKAKELAASMYARGADIVSQNAGSSGLGVFQAAAEADKYVIGTSLSMVDKEHSLSTSRKKVELFVVEEIASHVNGTWKSGTVVKGIKEGICDYDVENLNVTIPSDVIEQLENAKSKIASGELSMPKDISEIDEWTEKYTIGN